MPKNSVEVTRNKNGYMISNYNKFGGSSFILLTDKQFEQLIKDFEELKEIYE